MNQAVSTSPSCTAAPATEAAAVTEGRKSTSFIARRRADTPPSPGHPSQTEGTFSARPHAFQMTPKPHASFARDCLLSSDLATGLRGPRSPGRVAGQSFQPPSEAFAKASGLARPLCCRPFEGQKGGVSSFFPRPHFCLLTELGVCWGGRGVASTPPPQAIQGKSNQRGLKAASLGGQRLWFQSPSWTGLAPG